jgi:L-threonylcarbamoyladenylate synthase
MMKRSFKQVLIMICSGNLPVQALIPPGVIWYIVMQGKGLFLVGEFRDVKEYRSEQNRAMIIIDRDCAAGTAALKAIKEVEDSFSDHAQLMVVDLSGDQGLYEFSRSEEQDYCTCLISGNATLLIEAVTRGFVPLFIMGCGDSADSSVLPDGVFFFHELLDALRWVGIHPCGRASLEREIEKGVAAIKSGGLAVFPTETVYGLGADAMNENAVKKIFIAKERPFQDPLISHVCSRDQVRTLVASIPQKSEKLMDAFWPGPLTLVMEKHPSVPDIVTAGNPTVAVRMPHHPIARELIERSGTPIAAPSANRFGKTSPTTAEHVIDQLAGRFDAIIDGGASRVGVESTVLSLVGSDPVLLRPGGITIEEIEQVIGPIKIKEHSGKEAFDSPGMFPSHYAPRTPMIVVDDPKLYSHEPHIAVMLFGEPEVAYAGTVFMLSSRGDDRDAAAKLYQTMRLIDEGDFRLIVAQRLPDRGMGTAVNDRMGRASTS